MIKLTRLVITLLYVETPQDKDVLSTLIENIEINAPKTRGKK